MQSLNTGNGVAVLIAGPCADNADDNVVLILIVVVGNSPCLALGTEFNLNERLDGGGGVGIPVAHRDSVVAEKRVDRVAGGVRAVCRELGGGSYPRLAVGAGKSRPCTEEQGAEKEERREEAARGDGMLWGKMVIVCVSGWVEEWMG